MGDNWEVNNDGEIITSNWGRLSLENENRYARFVDEEFTGHSLDTLSKWRLQNTGGRGSHQIKDDDENGILELVTGNQINDEMILDVNNKRYVDPSNLPVIIIGALALSIADVEVRLGLVDVLDTDHCIFDVDVSATGVDIYAEAYSGGVQTHTADTGINLDVNPHEYIIEIDAAGRPYWYIDGVLVVTGDNADVDPTEFFQPYSSIRTEAAAIKTLELDYIRGLQRRE